MTRPPHASNAVELLLRLAHGEPVTPEQARRCLVARAGRRTDAVDRIAQVRLRDAAIADAARALGWPDVSNWSAASQLERLHRRFVTVHWPRIQGGRPVDLSPVNEALARAYLTGERVPETARGIYNILRNKEPDVSAGASQHRAIVTKGI